MDHTILKYKKLSQKAFSPSKTYEDDVGYDLKSPHSYIITPNDIVKIELDLQLEIPDNCYGRIAPRSSLSLNFIDVKGGVIDKNYRGNVSVILHNFGSIPYNINRGDKIAQLICEKSEYPILLEVHSLNQTKRIGGFGSTGIN